MADFEIGTTLGGTTNLELLTTPVPAPKSAYLPFARAVPLGNGGTRGIGAPIAVWTFPILSIEEYSQLKSFCPNASADIFIRTKIDDDTYDDFSGKMIWPNEPQDRWYGERRNFVIQFRNLVAV